MIFQRESNVTLPLLESQNNSIMSDIYTKPWCRVGAYMVGMMTGYFLYINKNQFRLNKVS